MNEELKPCPCCGSKVLTALGEYEICDVCGWEDDPVQYNDFNYRGGANHPRLLEAREFLRAIQVSNPNLKHLARPPRREELPESNRASGPPHA